MPEIMSFKKQGPHHITSENTPNFPSIACCKECTCNGLNAKLALLKWFPGILLILRKHHFRPPV